MSVWWWFIFGGGIATHPAHLRRAWGPPRLARAPSLITTPPRAHTNPSIHTLSRGPEYALDNTITYADLVLHADVM